MSPAAPECQALLVANHRRSAPLRQAHPKGSEPCRHSTRRPGLSPCAFSYPKSASPAGPRVSRPWADRLTCRSPDGGHQRPRKDRRDHTAVSCSVYARANSGRGHLRPGPETRAVCAGVRESTIGRGFAVSARLTRPVFRPP